MPERPDRRTPPPDLPLFAARTSAPAPVRVIKLPAGARRCGLAALTVGIAALAVTIVLPPRPVLLWNASASAPAGLYRIVAPAPLVRGDMVAAWPPAAARDLAARRRYLPRNVPLVKRVAAVAGDRVCARGRILTVAGKAVAVRRARDAVGRTLPAWHGCVTLGRGAMLLLNDAPASFDGRYFGPSASTDVMGRAIPLWLR